MEKSKLSGIGVCWSLLLRPAVSLEMSEDIPHRYLSLLSFVPSDLLSPSDKNSKEETRVVFDRGWERFAMKLTSLFNANKVVTSEKQHYNQHSASVERLISEKEHQATELIQQQNDRFVQKETRGFLQVVSDSVKYLGGHTAGIQLRADHIAHRSEIHSSLRAGDSVSDDHSMHTKQDIQYMRQQKSQYLMSEDFSKQFVSNVSSQANKEQKLVQVTQNFGDIIIQPATMELGADQLKSRLADALKQVRDSMFY